MRVRRSQSLRGLTKRQRIPVHDPAAMNPLSPFSKRRQTSRSAHPEDALQAIWLIRLPIENGHWAISTSTINGEVTFSQSTLSGNFTTGTDADGGAIYGLDGTVMVSQSTLTANHTNLSAGGAIGSFSAPVTIRNSVHGGRTGHRLVLPGNRRYHHRPVRGRGHRRAVTVAFSEQQGAARHWGHTYSWRHQGYLRHKLRQALLSARQCWETLAFGKSQFITRRVMAVFDGKSL
jgi:hypothetical protein